MLISNETTGKTDTLVLFPKYTKSRNLKSKDTCIANNSPDRYTTTLVPQDPQRITPLRVVGMNWTPIKFTKQKESHKPTDLKYG